MSPLSLGCVSRVAPSAHVPRLRPAAEGSSSTSLRGPPDCRSPAPCLSATIARNHVYCKGGLGLAAARTRGAEKRRARGLARSANRDLTRRRCLSVESEANEASSAARPRDRASQGSRRNAPTAEHKRRSQAKHAFAWGPNQQAKNIERTDERANDRNGPIAGTRPSGFTGCLPSVTRHTASPSATTLAPLEAGRINLCTV